MSATRNGVTDELRRLAKRLRRESHKMIAAIGPNDTSGSRQYFDGRSRGYCASAIILEDRAARLEKKR
jgi:hypothetical protein